MSSIIVIGAGISGLCAALELSKTHRVTVLEARNRLGGRIYTVTGSDNHTCIELGASYWEGFNDNPLYTTYFSPTKQTAKPFVLQLKEQDSQIIDLDSPKKENLPKEDILKYYELAGQYLKQANQHRLNKTFDEIINHIDYSALGPAQAMWVKKIIELQCIHQTTPLSQIGFPDFTIPRDNTKYTAYNEASANFCFVGNGFNKLINQIASQCTDNGVDIFTNCPVTHISDNGINGVTLNTAQGQFTANKVICTIPLGVLKTQAHTLFRPSLSAEKMQAIKNIGVHASTRVVLEFETPFWDNPAHCPYILLKNSQSPGMKEFRSNYPLHGKAILQTPSFAKESENLNDQDLIKLITHQLQTAFPNQAIHLQHFIVHRWTNDPYAQGAYPYRTLLMDENNHGALERPEGNLYFAGADFSRFGFSVQHAYFSGLQTAQRILDNL